MDRQIRIGDLVKAFDFQPMEGRKDRYVVGIVKTIGMVESADQRYEAYTIDCVYDSCGVYRVGREIHVPVEIFFAEYAGRVTRV